MNDVGILFRNGRRPQSVLRESLTVPIAAVPLAADPAVSTYLLRAGVGLVMFAILVVAAWFRFRKGGARGEPSDSGMD